MIFLRKNLFYSFCPSWKSLRAIRINHTILKIPPNIAKIRAILYDAGAKVAQIVKINKITVPRIPLYEAALLKIPRRSMTNEIMMPATPKKRKPVKAPGVKSSPRASIACPAAVNMDLWASVVAAAYLSLRRNMGIANK